MPPDVLVVCTEPRSESPERIRLLTGSFYLVDGTADPPPATTLSLAQRADALERFLDVILRGIQVCATAFRDSEKQTMIWREELEECGQQQDSESSETPLLTCSDGCGSARRPISLLHDWPLWTSSQRMAWKPHDEPNCSKVGGQPRHGILYYPKAHPPEHIPSTRAYPSHLGGALGLVIRYRRLRDYTERGYYPPRYGDRPRHVSAHGNHASRFRNGVYGV